MIVAALNERVFIKIGNMGIPESLIPDDAGETGASYAFTRDESGNLEPLNVSTLSGFNATIVNVAPGDFVPDGELYRCDIAVDDMTAQTWVDVLPYGDSSVSFFESYGEKTVTTYDGGFAIFAIAMPSAQLTLTFTAFKITQGGD